MQFIQDTLAVWPEQTLMPPPARVVMEGVKLVPEIFEAGFRLSECISRFAERFLPPAQATQAQIVRIQAAHGVADNEGFCFQPCALLFSCLH